MFDEKNVEDMFDPAEKGAAVPKPTAPLLTPPPAKPEAGIPNRNVAPVMDAAEPGPTHSHIGVFKGALIAIFVLALIGGAGYAAWRLMAQEPSTDGPVRSVDGNGVVAEDENEDEGKGDGEEIAPDIEDRNDVSEPQKPTFLDSDGDGLMNAEELEAGTDVSEADTDRDGLGDREEVKVYGTDPRDEDTDGDSFLDGQEVAGGYNPNGDGKLFNVPTE